VTPQTISLARGRAGRPWGAPVVGPVRRNCGLVPGAGWVWDSAGLGALVTPRIRRRGAERPPPSALYRGAPDLGGRRPGNALSRTRHARTAACDVNTHDITTRHNNTHASAPKRALVSAGVQSGAPCVAREPLCSAVQSVTGKHTGGGGSCVSLRAHRVQWTRDKGAKDEPIPSRAPHIATCTGGRHARLNAPGRVSWAESAHRRERPRHHDECKYQRVKISIG